MFANPFMTPWGMYIIPLLIWSMIWKGIGLWKAGNNKQPVWFIFMFLLNTVGILPIIYILWFQKKPLAGTEKVAAPIVIRKVVKRKPARKKPVKKKAVKKTTKKKPKKKKAVKKKAAKRRKR